MNKAILASVVISLLLSCSKDRGNLVVPPTTAVPQNPPTTPDKPKGEVFSFSPVTYVYGGYTLGIKELPRNKECIETMSRRIYVTRVNSGNPLPLGTIIKAPDRTPWGLRTQHIVATTPELSLEGTSYKGKIVFPNYPLEKASEWLSRYDGLCKNYYAIQESSEPGTLTQVGSVYESSYYGENTFMDLRTFNAYFRSVYPNAETLVFGQRYEDQTKPFKGIMYPIERLAFSLISDNTIKDIDESSIQDNECFIQAIYFGSLSVLAIQSDENPLKLKQIIHKVTANKPLQEEEEKIYNASNIVFFDLITKRRLTGRSAIEEYKVYRNGKPKISPLYYTMVDKDGSYHEIFERYEFIKK